MIFISATSNPLCSSKIVMTNVSCDFDTGPCAFKIPMYPHLWEITRYGYGNTRIGVIDGDHTSSKFIVGDHCLSLFISEHHEIISANKTIDLNRKMSSGSALLSILIWLFYSK